MRMTLREIKKYGLVNPIVGRPSWTSCLGEREGHRVVQKSIVFVLAKKHLVSLCQTTKNHILLPDHKRWLVLHLPGPHSLSSFNIKRSTPLEIFVDPNLKQR